MPQPHSFALPVVGMGWPGIALSPSVPHAGSQGAPTTIEPWTAAERGGVHGNARKDIQTLTNKRIPPACFGRYRSRNPNSLPPA
jgi:hypothetical protein